MKLSLRRDASNCARVVLLITSFFLLSACGDSHEDSSPQAVARAACSYLTSAAVPAASIGLPTTGAKVVSATFVTADTAGNADGEYCKVLGVISPVDPSALNINFEVNLPSIWNGKALQLGGAASDGVLVTGLGIYPGATATAATPVAQGYVTFGSDSGHQGTSDKSFISNQESFRNFGGDQIKKTHDAALALAQIRYGKKSQYTYFIGGSQGGHEAFIAVQRYPQDYDGAVAMYPTYNSALLQLASNAFAKTIYGNAGAGWLDPNKIALLQNAVYNTCDGLDGVKDGIISNVAACQTAFTIQTVQQTLRCPGGTDAGDTCLSDTQIAAVNTLDSPFKLGFPLADGQQTFPHWSILEGAKFLTGFGASRTPSHPPAPTDAFQYLISDPSVRYYFTNNPNIDSINGFNPDDYQQQIVAVSTVLETTNPDIAAFKARGGKLILLHGTADEAVSPYNTINYYNQMISTLGQASLDQFVRFYIVPGFGHGSGIFNAQWDPLTVIDSWVTQGNTPGTLTASDGNKGATRSRPLCVYPAWPKYNGSGDINSVSSFSCATS